MAPPRTREGRLVSVRMAGCSAVAPAGSSCEGQGETVQKTKAGEHGKTHCKPETAAAAVEDDDPRIPASGTSHHDEGENGGASCASPSDDETYALASRKALKRLLPVLLPLVVVNYMDRAALSLTASALMHKLGMSETTLGVAMGVFYGPYCALQLPSLWLAKHVSVRWWLATITVAWGCTTFGTAFVTARWQLIVARLLLGAAEAGTFPLLYYYLDQFLSPLDMAQTWSCGVVTSMQIATVIAAPVATLVLSTLEGALGCEGWQWVYLILGGLGVFVGILILLLLLDPPTKTSIFSR